MPGVDGGSGAGGMLGARQGDARWPNRGSWWVATGWLALLGRRMTRFCASITTPSGGCRCATSAGSTNASASKSWATILRKRPAFRDAFDGFDPEAVALYGEADVRRLMSNEGIVRNGLKIRAAITNAAATVRLREQGGLAAFVWSFQPDSTPMPRTPEEIPTKSPESEALAAALKREGFVFVGPTTMFALMSAVGLVDVHLMGSHRRGSSGLWPA